MSSQLGQITLDVAEGEALAGLLGEVEDVAGNESRRPRSRARVDCRPPIAEVVEITFVPTASVKRTSRDTGCAGIDDLRRQPKYPVAQV